MESRTALNAAKNRILHPCVKCSPNGPSGTKVNRRMSIGYFRIPDNVQIQNVASLSRISEEVTADIVKGN